MAFFAWLAGLFAPAAAVATPSKPSPKPAPAAPKPIEPDAVDHAVGHTVSRIISDDTLSRIIQIESGGNPKAKAKTSSAAGLGQFISSTWLSMLKKYRPEVMKGRNSEAILALRTDPTQTKLNIEVLARFTEENAAAISALGGRVTDGGLYLAHFLGAATARAVCAAPPSTPTRNVVSAVAIQANPSILRNKTCAQVIAWADQKMKAAGGTNWVAKWWK